MYICMYVSLQWIALVYVLHTSTYITPYISRFTWHRNGRKLLLLQRTLNIPYLSTSFNVSIPRSALLVHYYTHTHTYMHAKCMHAKYMHASYIIHTIYTYIHTYNTNMCTCNLRSYTTLIQNVEHHSQYRGK